MTTLKEILARLPKFNIHFRIILLLFTISVVARIATSLIQIDFGIQQIQYLPLSSWTDFYTLYGYYMRSLGAGLLPYRDFYYYYTPLFAYCLYVFYILGGMHLASLPVVLADSATAPLVYMIASIYTSKRVAFLSGIAYAICPLALVMEGYLWLSSQPMVFFLLLSVFFLLTNKPASSAVSLAVAVLFKQEAIFLAPAYAAFYFNKNKFRLPWKYITTFSCIVVAVSAPFLILAMKPYLFSISYGLLGQNYIYVGKTLVQTFGTTLASPTSASVLLNTCRSSSSSILSGTFPACTVTYSVGAPNVFATIQEIVNFVGNSTYFLIFLFVAPALYFCRKRDNFLELAGAYSIVGGLVVYSVLVHGLWLYYFLPAYALLFASARSVRGFAIALVASVLSVFTPEGTIFPILLISLAVLGMIATGDGARIANALTKETISASVSNR